MEPEGGKTERPVLKLYNSLTKKKEDFTPRSGNKVYWYSCGPTVYDAAHMGHARSYISFDILRRVLQSYFHYDVVYVMNITDIDDKIIKRARVNHLFENYVKEMGDTNVEKLHADGLQARSLLLSKLKSEGDPDVKAMLERAAESMEKGLAHLQSAMTDSKNNQQHCRELVEAYLDAAKDQISEWLDKNADHSFTDNSIFSELPKRWEEDFLNDMKALNVLPPDILTRVSEYIPEIVDYIQVIIKNGFAYESNSSVYFDVAKFKESGYSYAKLVPEAVGDLNQLQAGEGALTSDTNEKRAPADFALWKKSKRGEPSWASPWGKGRPGWHIECSVMASAICGAKLDIHTGGVDLKFPHHDNEIAQVEAHYETHDWVQYFLHSGHLTISGCKMSKSLKNFITIKDALSNYTARQLRIAFLLHSWKDTLDYSENTMVHALSYEKFLNEFFMTVKDMKSQRTETKLSDEFVKYNAKDIQLHERFLLAKHTIHVALCDNIDTRTALAKIKELISDCNSYMKDSAPNANLLNKIAWFVTDIMTVFGVIQESEYIGFKSSSSGEVDTESLLRPYLNILGRFRANVRKIAKEVKAYDILTECDVLRDETLPEVKIRLEDKDDGRFVIKHDENAQPKKALNDKVQLKGSNEKNKAPPVKEEVQPPVRPSDMFREATDKYSKFDDLGIPTHDNTGEELSKSQRKKLVKLYQLQEKKYEKFQSA